jgi:hypothetical protein
MLVHVENDPFSSLDGWLGGRSLRRPAFPPIQQLSMIDCPPYSRLFFFTPMRLALLVFVAEDGLLG